MTERPFVPAEPDWPAGAALPPARHGHRSRRRVPARRRPPGRATAAALSLVLGVSAAILLTFRQGEPPAEVGAPASVAALSGAGDRPPAGRGDRGQARAIPVPAGGSSTAGQVTTGRLPSALPARTLVPPPPSSTARPPAGRPAPTAPTGTGPAPTTTTVSDDVLRLTNVERAKAGCGALHVDARLTAAAQDHSEDMANRGYFSHTTPEGKSPWDRAKAAGYADPSAENIAMGYRTPEAVVAGWMGSAGHRANILNCASHAIGIGYDPRGFYWTQLFGYR